MRPSTSVGWYVLSIIVLSYIWWRGTKPATPDAVNAIPSASASPRRHRRSRCARSPRWRWRALPARPWCASADTLLPQIAADFAITVGAASIVITAYALTHGSMQFITGPIGDRFGKYRTVARRLRVVGRARWRCAALPARSTA